MRQILFNNNLIFFERLKTTNVLVDVWQTALVVESGLSLAVDMFFQSNIFLLFFPSFPLISFQHFSRVPAFSLNYTFMNHILIRNINISIWIILLPSIIYPSTTISFDCLRAILSATFWFFLACGFRTSSFSRSFIRVSTPPDKISLLSLTHLKENCLINRPKSIQLLIEPWSSRKKCRTRLQKIFSNKFKKFWK